MSLRASRDEDLTILVVEDNPQNCDLIVTYLAPHYAKVLTAADGVQAIDLAARRHPDLVLLDIMLPGIDGFEVCRRIKADPATANTPVVMVTALGGVQDIQRAVDVGADDFLTKPIKRVELLMRVRSLVRMRQLHWELDETLAQMDRLRQSLGEEAPPMPPADDVPLGEP